MNHFLFFLFSDYIIHIDSNCLAQLLPVERCKIPHPFVAGCIGAAAFQFQCRSRKSWATSRWIPSNPTGKPGKPRYVHPGRLTAGTYKSPIKRKENDLKQTSMMMFHVNLQGCTVSIWKSGGFSWGPCAIEFPKVGQMSQQFSKDSKRLCGEIVAEQVGCKLIKVDHNIFPLLPENKGNESSSNHQFFRGYVSFPGGGVKGFIQNQKRHIGINHSR